VERPFQGEKGKGQPPLGGRKGGGDSFKRKSNQPKREKNGFLKKREKNP